MRDRIFNIAVVVSLLLFVVILALWPRSYWRDDGWSWGARTGRAGVDSFRGRVTFGRVDVPAAALARIPRGQMIVSVPAGQAALTLLNPNWSFAGFQATRVNQGGIKVLEVRVPHWALLLVTGILPAIFMLKPRRVAPGCCRACGYDLTGNVSGVCPECGNPVLNPQRINKEHAKDDRTD